MAGGSVFVAVPNQYGRGRYQANVVSLLPIGDYGDEEGRNNSTVLSNSSICTGFAIYAAHPLSKALVLSSGVEDAVAAKTGMALV